MARKHASPVSESSQKENADFRARGQPISEKVKGKSAQRTALREEVDAGGELDHNEASGEEKEGDQGEEEEVEQEEEEEEGSPKGRKRARANTLGDARPSQLEVKTEPKTLPRDLDGCASFW